MLVFAPGKRKAEPHANQTDFWVSYSDLLAGLLLVFVLLLVVVMFNYGKFVQRKEVRLKQQQEKLQAFQEVHHRLVENLRNALHEEAVTVDATTGVVQINSGILFGEGEAELMQDGRARLDKIFETYIQTVLSDEFADFVKQIEIEGHTNSNGPYLYNLELSQQRALAVMKALLERAGPNREKLQKMVSAGGRSFAHLVRDEYGREDQVKSRRIELKFRLKEAEMFKHIYEELAE